MNFTFTKMFSNKEISTCDTVNQEDLYDVHREIPL